MLNSVRFECVTLGTKAGVLSKDSDGYYTMPVGGLNVYNSAKQFYVYEEAKHIFDESSQFQRRVQKGVLRAENGHPQYEKGMTEKEYVTRVLTIKESNTCAFFKEVWLDFDNIKDNMGVPVIAIMAKVCPSGPYADMLERRFNQPGENVCFSIRAFTRDYMDRGVMKRVLDTVVTFDCVNEPGIDFAEKFKSPALEAYQLEDHLFSKSTIKHAFDDQPKGVATESSVLLTYNELCSALGWSEKPSKPGYSNW